MINIEKIEVDVGGLGHITNSYLIYDEGLNAVLIDPGYEANKIISYIENNNLKLEYIILTHAHGDHIGAVEKLVKYTNATVIIHQFDVDMLYGKIENYSNVLQVPYQDLTNINLEQVNNGDVITCGDIVLEVIHTPGHTRGSACFFENNTDSLFTGDTIFCDSYGRCDLETGSIDEIADSIKKIFERFDHVVIYPGHNEIANISYAKKRVKMLLGFKGYKV